jgi:hypothetical protein
VTASRVTAHTPSDDPAQSTPPLNRAAVWSLATSALTLFGLGSIIGIALGVVALNQIAVHRQRGRWLAIGGIALGAVTLFVSMIVVVKVFVAA